MSVVVEDLTVTYTRMAVATGEPVLQSISLAINKGEKFGILGPTGSGKSSLALCLNGSIPKVIPALVKGRILIEEKDTSTLSAPEITQRVGLVFPNPDYGVIQILVEDDVAFGPSNLNLSIDQIRERVEFAIDACRLRGYEKRSTADLSGGETQSVGVAGVMAMRTPIMVLDEPITMLDPVGKETVLSVSSYLNQRHELTMIITEAGNDIEYFARFVDRIAVLHKGRIVAVDSARKILSNRELMEKIGVQPPPVTRLFSHLPGIQHHESSSVPITLEEGVALMKNLLGTKRLRLKSPHSKIASSQVTKREEPLIQIRNLTHIYPPNIRALDGVDLDIFAGERMAIIGQNGSGKTTLAYHLVGLLKPSNKDAKVMVDGIDVASKKTALQETIKHINYVFQNPDAQLSQETVWEEATYGLKLRMHDPEEVKRKADEVLGLFGIGDKKDKAIIEASLDLKRYLTIASLLCLEPKILILDEPTNGLDYDGGKKVIDTMKRLNTEKGLTVIMITHNMDLVASFAERVVVMRNGRILMEGPAGEVYSNPEKLKEAYLYPPQTARLFQALGLSDYQIMLPEEAANAFQDSD